ncbi:MAG: cyclic nucleotide-binding domain-containing protein [Gemmataceae bacterium]|nr:cyclic nucleotide-binding domain-containing protein [Gemmataceae bacterium]
MTEPISPSTLQHLSFLAGAPEVEVRRLAEAASWANHPAGTVIFREGDTVNRMWIVVAGKVAIDIVGAERRLHHIQTIVEGELLGWSPVLGTGPMTASARALTDVRCIAIDSDALLAMCEADPRFGFQIMRRVAIAIAGRLHSMRQELLKYYDYVAPTSHL